MTTPLDLTALARDLIDVAPRDGWRDFLGVELPKLLTLSRTAGRVEGLENAAKWHDAEAMQAELSAARLEAAGLAINAGHWRVEAREARARATAIRALASDPAPGDQPAPRDQPIETLQRLRELVTCLLENDPDDDAADGATVLDVWREKARTVLTRSEPSDGAIYAAASRAPAHPTEPGEVERREAAAFAIWTSNGGLARIWGERQTAREGYPLHEQVTACYRQADAVLAALSKGPTP